MNGRFTVMVLTLALTSACTSGGGADDAFHVISLGKGPPAHVRPGGKLPSEPQDTGALVSDDTALFRDSEPVADTGTGTGPVVDTGPVPVVDAPGTELLDVTDCAAMPGATIPTPGNVSTPLAAYDPENIYFAYVSDEATPRAVVSHYDRVGCTAASRVNVIDEPPAATSHDPPTLHVDGDGYVYATYFGGVIWQNEGTVDGPYMRRTTRPNDLTEWGEEGRSRLYNLAELHSLRLSDGALLLAGSDFHSRIDVIEPGGAYRWDAARQVVTQKTWAAGSNDGLCSGNRFTKGVFEQGSDGTLYVVWGWGGGGAREPRPAGCEDVRHYSDDSHEVFFAYSTDGGLTWQNKDGTRSVSAPLCATEADCQNIATQGIVHNDPDFAITSTRQREHRKLWADDDGTIYVAFTKSTWCDAGYCTTRDVTDPGALVLLRFTLGGAVEEMVVDTDEHFNVGGVRKQGDALYIWASEASPWRTVEYVSTDDGLSWSRTELRPETCNRLHGETRNRAMPDSVRMSFTCTTSTERRVYYYRRTF